MLTRRGFGACAICATAGLVATPVAAQPIGQPQTAGGVTRTILQRTDLDEKHIVLLVMAEVPANTVVARHTHPGVESAYIMEGGFQEFTVQGQPNFTVPKKAGDALHVPPGTPHGGKTGAQTTKLLITYVVEKDKPLASPA
jgi:quercetin dioxygenase-like cupin family protein